MSVEPYTESWLKGPLSTMFYTRLYEPPISTPLRAALVFAHGYLEHIGRYTEVHAKWAQRGIAVFAYDERGFGRTALDEKHKSPNSVYGRTGGAEERMGDIEWAVKHTRSLFDKAVPLFLMGQLGTNVPPKLIGNSRSARLARDQIAEDDLAREGATRTSNASTCIASLFVNYISHEVT